jgi:hypothetical protein
MPRIRGTTDAQSSFLRALAKSELGPGKKPWPSAVVMRRWLRKPGFIAAMRRVRQAMRYQADFQLYSSAASAAHRMQSIVCEQGGEIEPKLLAALSSLLKLAHVRERFAVPDPKAEMRDGELMTFLRQVHPTVTVRSALDYIERYCTDDSDDVGED